MVRGKTIGEGKDNKKRDGDGVGAELRKVRDMKCKESGVLRTSGGCAARTFEGESGKEVRRISGGCAADILEENSMTGEMGGKGGDPEWCPDVRWLCGGEVRWMGVGLK